MSFEGKINVFDCEVKAWISILISLSGQGFLLVFCSNSGDSYAFAVKVDSTSSVVEVDAKLDFQNSYPFSQCTNINKQVIDLEVDHQGLLLPLFLIKSI